MSHPRRALRCAARDTSRGGARPTDSNDTPDDTPCWRDRGGHLWSKDRHVVTADGTVVKYAVRGPVDAPWVVCCAGYLCPDNFWHDIAPDLARDHRVLILNYRGVGASSEAGGGDRPTGPEGYTLEALAGDVAAAMDAEGATDATAVGHSMGVQVALALWRSRPELVGRLALLGGPYSSPLHTFYGTGAGRALFPLVSVAMPALPTALTKVVMRSLELPVALPVARAIKALGPHTPDAGMRTYRWHLSRVDPRTAIWTARGMHAFDAGPWLHEIDVPTLMAIGTADAWCPPAVAHALADRVPHTRLVLIPEGSHALPIEFPDQLIAEIRALTPA